MGMFEVHLIGLDELERNVNKLIKKSHQEELALLQSQANLVKTTIRAWAPLGPTGNLKAAAYVKTYSETLRSPAIAFAGIRPRKAPHAHLVEYGHAGPHPAPPHPFFRPAWDEVREQVYRNIKEGLRRIALRTP